MERAVWATGRPFAAPHRKTPVIFGGSGGQPYPTSAADIKAWLTDHYFEHVPHVAELLQGWRAAAAGREVVR